jgi:hypothetical protein
MISSPYLSIASRARRRLQLFSNSRCFRRSSRTALRARRLRKRSQHDLMVGRVAFLIDRGRPLPPQTRPRCARRLLHGDRASSTLCPSCCLRHAGWVPGPYCPGGWGRCRRTCMQADGAARLSRAFLLRAQRALRDEDLGTPYWRCS